LGALNVDFEFVFGDLVTEPKQNRCPTQIPAQWSGVPIATLGPTTPPTDTSTIQAMTPSDIFSWAGPEIHQRSKRTGLEQKWFAVTGRVVDVKVEADGDLHIALSDATGDKKGNCGL
jgi:hypothetical protein